MKKVILFLGAFCIIATWLPVLPSDHWTVRVFDFPHAQITVLTLIVLGAAFYFFDLRERRDAVFMALLTASLLFQFTIILPYLPLAKVQVMRSDGADEKASISLLSANILMDNNNTILIREQIEAYDPDIIALLEPDEKWRQAMIELRQEYPYYVEEPLDNTYGLLLYSRLKLIDPQVKYVMKEGIPSVHTRVALPSGDQIQLYVVHPEPPSPTESETSTKRDGELLLTGKMAAKDSLPVIVIGDLNDVAWSPSTRLFQEVSGLLDPRIGRGFYNTFNANIPLLRWPLDHVFHSDHFKLIQMLRLPNIESDHFPIFIQLSLEPEAEAQQEEPQASPSEEKNADKQIRKAQEPEQ